jgi:hypothetical protein
MGAIMTSLTVYSVYYSTLLMLKITEAFKQPKAGFYETWTYSLGRHSVVLYKFFIIIF